MWEFPQTKNIAAHKAKEYIKISLFRIAAWPVWTPFCWGIGFHIILMSLFEDSKAEQRPVRDESRERGKKRLQFHCLLAFPRAAQRAVLQEKEVLSPVWYSLCQGRIGGCQAEHFTLASSHWGLTSFLPASPEHTRVGVLSKGLTPPLPFWLYCSALCCSKRNAELLSETLTQDLAAWAINS